MHEIRRILVCPTQPAGGRILALEYKIAQSRFVDEIWRGEELKVIKIYKNYILI